jgi:hypothetical protein
MDYKKSDSDFPEKNSVRGLRSLRSVDNDNHMVKKWETIPRPISVKPREDFQDLLTISLHGKM